jgi:hypothetical protein
MNMALRMLALAAVAGIGLLAANAEATTYYPEKMTCPIGGKTFTYNAMGSNSSWGSRPDGKLYSPAPVVEMPECPDNGLVMYRTFSKDELKILAGLIDAADYKALAKTDTQYYRAAWLEGKLAPGSTERPWMLLTATYEAQDGSPQKAKYQAEFVKAAESVPVDIDNMETLYLAARVANAHRELGAFDAALALLDRLPLAQLHKDLPADEKAAEALPDDDKRQHAFFFVGFVDRLRSVILRKDSAAEPLDVIPEHMAAMRCFFDEDKLTDFERGFCARADIKAKIDERRADWTEAKARRNEAGHNH